MTLSRKHKLNITQFNSKYRRADSSIMATVSKGKKRFETVFELPNLVRNPMGFLYTEDKDPLSFLNMEIRTINDFGQPCASCGSTDRVEMHHVRHVRTINPKLNTFDKLMAKINRKQVPLCHNCHRDIHTGKYDGKSLKFLTRKKEEV